MGHQPCTCAIHAALALAVRKFKINFPFLFEGTETNEKENGGLRDQRPKDPGGLLSAFIKFLTNAWHRSQQRRVENELRLVAIESQMRLPFRR